MTATSSARRADTEVPGSPGAERPSRDVGKLTPRQARFVDEYLIDLNATQAAIRAGYSGKTAQEQSSRLLSNVMVAAAIEKERAKRSERVSVSQDDVVRGLHGEATAKGEGSSPSARVSAWFHLGKHLGMFVDRRLVGTVKISEMIEAQLIALLGLGGLPEDEVAERLRSMVSPGRTHSRGNGSGRRTH